MKKIILILLVICCQLLIDNSFAQTPQAVNYQAVARDKTGNLLVDFPIKIRISILHGTNNGSAVYVETQSITTNKLGVINLEIGNGIPVSGTFSSISWGSNKHFLQMEMDIDGNGYVFSGVSQLLSVPYTIFSDKSAGSVLNAPNGS
jgi:hypothetical protein